MNRKKFKQGIRSLLIALLLMFSGPIIIYSAFKNQGHSLYLPVLIVGLAICVSAIAMGFKGVFQLVNALFQSTNTHQGE
jgi:F0F1-type ATP synthase membrane subunit c/vacuolar-type H+-ATPase subunit K